ncbi:MAG: Rrf2 family transcriptional regulator [Gemmatimonadota bacterium]|jgi:Rrf2 family protein|nr:transcriptional regulator [Gemmatimonadota bacterium]MDP6460129.1 Rrf2 family transcriptional regulator [Gemmatimonadota bacterium]MDP6528831.1 Rrf2 family transcriptional regulator [Gemmatimonadota bacterium]MDP6802385.1 Rrf2 family transcriptional regulator [Gemmatimonadota bacterium]MDP7031101.1 Rrf2 family transcriptional regulator [Gemmatimonadota bacterium]
MFFSTSCEYALRALTHLALYGKDAPVQVKDIAETEGIPRHFLAKILNQLTYKGMVRALRGPGGGFLLTKPPHEVRVVEIVDAIDGIDNIRNRCVVGLDECRDDAHCPMHDIWKRFRETFLGNVEELALSDMADTMEMKRNLPPTEEGGDRPASVQPGVPEPPSED